MTAHSGRVGRSGTRIGEGWLTWLGAVPPREINALYRRYNILLFPNTLRTFQSGGAGGYCHGLQIIGSNAVQG